LEADRLDYMPIAKQKNFKMKSIQLADITNVAIKNPITFKIFLSNGKVIKLKSTDVKFQEPKPTKAPRKKKHSKFLNQLS